MRLVWSMPVRGEPMSSSRGDLVRARSLIAALREQGHEVHVVAAADQAAAEFTVSTYRSLARRLLPAPAALIARDVGRWLHGISHGRRVAAKAVSVAAEVIVETQVNYALSGVVAARKTGLPLILDDCAPTSEEEELGAGLPRLARRILRQQFAAASVLTAPSRALLDRFVAEGAEPAKMLLVPNGVDPAAYRDHPEELRSRYGTEGRCVLGFVGSFQPWHGLDLLLEAIAPLSERLPLHLLLIGDGPGRPALQKLAARLGLTEHVTFVGAVPASEVPAHLSLLDIGLLPGANDYSHPMKLLEYGAAGLPSIAPDVAPVREIVSDGRSGLLFPLGDRAGLRSAIERLASDQQLCLRLGSEARARVVDGSSWSDRARVLSQAMRDSVVLAGSGARVRG